ncbi:hypothetical protein Moror_7594 [Moniliophthora roreri MCA 2997]|uniref:Uncharacterized protein n=1 Tax=Moniliophthora roreri (strain MCA 2997) TaxID=1381753 RepID=V2WAP5_MONRO|nr:hypothetical protein Moror_7594 [Moniliophthora roreri MCA 2997]
MSFLGEFIQVRGIKDTRQTNPNGDLSQDNVTALAKRTCEIDGSPISMIPTGTTSEQSQTGRHRRSQRANVLGGSDRVYTSPLKIDGSDPSIRCDNSTGNWRAVGTLGNGTFQTGASLLFNFSGTSVSLYEFNEGSHQDWQTASGRYYIDNSGNTAFEVPGNKRQPNRLSECASFHHPNLSPGFHEMALTYTGCAIELFGDDDGYVTNTGSVFNPAASSRLVLLVSAIFLFLRRRKAKKDSEGQRYDVAIPFYPDKMHAVNEADKMVPQSVHGYTRLVMPPAAANPVYDPYISLDERGSLYGTGASAASRSNQDFAGMKNAQRDAVSQEVVERCHQDISLRYPQGRTVIDVPPNYTEQ